MTEDVGEVTGEGLTSFLHHFLFHLNVKWTLLTKSEEWWIEIAQFAAMACVW